MSRGAVMMVCLGRTAPTTILAAVACGETTSLITGDVGVSPGTSITGFPADAATGAPFGLRVNDGAAINAQTATTALYNDLAGRPAGTAIAAELGGQVYGPGRRIL